jgi:hypothetical protein
MTSIHVWGYQFPIVIKTFFAVEGLQVVQMLVEYHLAEQEIQYRQCKIFSQFFLLGVQYKLMFIFEDSISRSHFITLSPAIIICYKNRLTFTERVERLTLHIVGNYGNGKKYFIGRKGLPKVP